jgi:hypothetical protein
MAEAGGVSGADIMGLRDKGLDSWRITYRLTRESAAS